MYVLTNVFRAISVSYREIPIFYFENSNNIIFHIIYIVDVIEKYTSYFLHSLHVRGNLIRILRNKSYIKKPYIFVRF